MSATPSTVDARSPRGYLSEDAKRKFTITTGILGAIFFFGQMIVPFVVVMVVTPATMFASESLFRRANVRDGAFWNGRIWYVEQSESQKPKVENGINLVSLALGPGNEPENVVSLPVGDARLLAADDRLWIVSSYAAWSYKEGQTTPVVYEENLGDISRPFIYDGDPAVIEERPSGLTLRVLVDGEWRKKDSFRLKSGEDAGPVLKDLQVVTTREGLGLFYRFGDTLYYRVGIPREGEQGWESWQVVSKAEGGWAAVSLAGEPAVFHWILEGWDSRIVGLRKVDSGWDSFFSHPAGVIADMGVYSSGDSGDFVILRQLFPGSLRVMEVEDFTVVRETEYGGTFPFSTPIMFIPYAGILIMPLILAFILSVQMRKYRVCEHVAGATTVPFAPLWRRALAQMIDVVFLGAPIIAGFVLLVSNLAHIDEMLNPAYMLGMFALWFGGFFWGVLGLVIFSCLEGRWGRTPGKWVTGIRVVGVDLQPCGFGRALVRNLLKFVDGFFNFMVGILLVALTDNWQRLGDLAARTVVVRVQPTYDVVPAIPSEEMRS